GSRIGLPVILVNGRGKGPRVVLCGATHPTELSGTATIHALTRRVIDPEGLRGSLICFPVANPLAMQLGRYVSPHDGANLAVSYPGSGSGGITSRIASFIWNQATLDADLVMDLHENVSPCLMFTLVGSCEDKEVERRTVDLARAFGLTVIRTAPVDLATPGMKPGDLYWAELAMKNGVPGFTVELEGRFESRFDETQAAVRIGVKGVMNVLRRLGMISGEEELQTETLVLEGEYSSYGVVRSNKGGLVNRFVDPGVKLKRGSKIAEVIDPYGLVAEEVLMPTDGYIWAWTIIGPDNPNWCVQTGSPIAYIFTAKS
ncbi:MAG: succinylglutamate desuccinylase/aspartoacylase family protein, partial [Candidatus Bathyarchaeia archaeon]